MLLPSFELVDRGVVQRIADAQQVEAERVMVDRAGGDHLSGMDDGHLVAVDRAVEQGVGEQGDRAAQRVVHRGGEGGRAGAQLVDRLAGHPDRPAGGNDAAMFGEAIEEQQAAFHRPAVAADAVGNLGDDRGVIAVVQVDQPIVAGGIEGLRVEPVAGVLGIGGALGGAAAVGGGLAGGVLFASEEAFGGGDFVREIAGRVEGRVHRKDRPSAVLLVKRSAEPKGAVAQQPRASAKSREAGRPTGDCEAARPKRTA